MCFDGQCNYLITADSIYNTDITPYWTNHKALHSREAFILFFSTMCHSNKFVTREKQNNNSKTYRLPQTMFLKSQMHFTFSCSVYSLYHNIKFLFLNTRPHLHLHCIHPCRSKKRCYQQLPMLLLTFSNEIPTVQKCP